MCVLVCKGYLSANKPTRPDSMQVVEWNSADITSKPLQIKDGRWVIIFDGEVLKRMRYHFLFTLEITRWTWYERSGSIFRGSIVIDLLCILQALRVSDVTVRTSQPVTKENPFMHKVVSRPSCSPQYNADRYLTSGIKGSGSSTHPNITAGRKIRPGSDPSPLESWT